MLRERFGEPRLAHAPRAHDTARDHPRLLSELAHPPLQIWCDASLEHLLHLVRDSRHRVDDLVTERADQAGRGPVRLGDHRRADRYVRLPQVRFGHLSSTRGEDRSHGVDHALVVSERDVHHLRDRLAGDVVVGGSESPAHDGPVAPRERGAQGEDDPLVVVTDRLVEVRGDADRGQLFAEPSRVGVGDLPEQQLGPHRDDLDAHEPLLPQPAEPAPPREAAAPGPAERCSAARRPSK